MWRAVCHLADGSGGGGARQRFELVRRGAAGAAQPAGSQPAGTKALALHPQDWKHAETEHFIYHFQKSYVATPVSVEAEFHFRVVSKELGKSGADWPQKAHIYIFERPEDWQLLQTAGGLEPWTGGIQAGGSLFIVRNPAFKFSDNSLGHEIVHLLVRRWYGERVPLWLNEGLAQYLSKNAHAGFQRARGYAAKPLSYSIAADKLFPLAALTTSMHYPPATQLETFYDQSEAHWRAGKVSRQLRRVCLAGRSRVSWRSRNSSALMRRRTAAPRWRGSRHPKSCRSRQRLLLSRARETAHLRRGNTVPGFSRWCSVSSGCCWW